MLQVPTSPEEAHEIHPTSALGTEGRPSPQPSRITRQVYLLALKTSDSSSEHSHSVGRKQELAREPGFLTLVRVCMSLSETKRSAVERKSKTAYPYSAFIPYTSKTTTDSCSKDVRRVFALALNPAWGAQYLDKAWAHRRELSPRSGVRKPVQPRRPHRDIHTHSKGDPPDELHPKAIDFPPYHPLTSAHSSFVLITW
ncbi:hypothetical protein CSIM01_00415 [Colletotrichum simmondsii]|uniref:Uncharacterized protein n=1 Tax=Colletotrichum simmondsii TaxID=703756 RepID=A0A135SF19_9PEZI|nr:hypothetical protein CSIM01_00415 [Colletotrichum simmondsii]